MLPTTMRTFGLLLLLVASAVNAFSPLLMPSPAPMVAPLFAKKSDEKPMRKRDKIKKTVQDVVSKLKPPAGESTEDKAQPPTTAPFGKKLAEKVADIASSTASKTAGKRQPISKQQQQAVGSKLKSTDSVQEKAYQILKEFKMIDCSD